MRRLGQRNRRQKQKNQYKNYSSSDTHTHTHTHRVAQGLTWMVQHRFLGLGRRDRTWRLEMGCEAKNKAKAPV